MTRLVSFSCGDIPQLGRIGLQRMSEPVGRLAETHVSSPDGKTGEKLGWQVVIRGAALFLVSPAGWSMTKPAAAWDRNGPRRFFEVPRAKVCLEWESDDFATLEKTLNRYDSEPMVRKDPEPSGTEMRMPREDERRKAG